MIPLFSRPKETVHEKSLSLLAGKSRFSLGKLGKLGKQEEQRKSLFFLLPAQPITRGKKPLLAG